MNPLLSRLRALTAPSGPASEAGRAERGLVLLLGVLRTGLIFQLVVASGVLVADASQPWPVLALAVAAAAFSVAYVLHALRAGTFSSVAWGVTDVTLGAASMLVTHQMVDPHLLQGSWIYWAPGYVSQTCVFIGAWLRSIRGALLLGTALGALYVVTTLAAGADDVSGVWVTSIAHPLFALAASLFARYTRGVASRADEARRHADESRQQAVDAAAALELARYSFHVHNATGLLEAFARPDLPPDLLPSLQRQARDEANRLRYEVLRGYQPAGTSSDTGPVTLDTVIWEATSGFGHLPLELALTLGRHARLTPRHALALKAALIAILYNVQLHAHARTVTVHADERDGTWEVTVTDDGVGFDVDPERFGFGLRRQVTGQLEHHGLEVSVRSRPGEGTCLTISGPVAP